MVHGLINYHKIGHNVFLLNGSNEEFALTKTEKIKMNDWNPLLLAIAYKKIEIVRYFLHDHNASLRIFGSQPSAPVSTTES